MSKAINSYGDGLCSVNTSNILEFKLLKNYEYKILSNTTFIRELNRRKKTNEFYKKQNTKHF